MNQEKKKRLKKRHAREIANIKNGKHLKASMMPEGHEDRSAGILIDPDLVFPSWEPYTSIPAPKPDYPGDTIDGHPYDPERDGQLTDQKGEPYDYPRGYWTN